MSDLIDRQTAIKTVQAYHCRYPEYMHGFVSKVLSAIKADLVEDIKELPTAEPKTGEQKTGKWLKAYGDHEAFGVRPFYRYCSACNESTVFPYNYCPNCGARMEGGKK